MNKYKKILSIGIILLSILGLSSCGGKEKLHIATSPDYAPYEFVNLNETGQDQYVGADISFAKYLCEQMGYELVLEAMDFDSTLASVAQGKVDLAISGFTYEEEREKNYEMSNSYSDAGEGAQLVLVLESRLEELNGFDKLNNSNIKIGAQTGSLQATYVEEQLPDATMQLVQKLSDGVQYLLNGNIDGLAIANGPALTAMASNPGLKPIDDTFEVSEKDGFFVLGQKGDKELMAKVNGVIEEVRSQNLYQTWLEEAMALSQELGDAAVEGIVEDDILLVKAWKMFTNYFGEFMKGLGITLALSLLGVILAALFGALLCFMKISKHRILRWISSAYIEFIRGIPLLLQLTVIFLVMPKGMPKFITCVVALVINSAAYQAEIFRSGILSIDKGQMEAARSLGLSYPKAMIKVILPQAIRNILPSLANEFVALIKETSLASTFYVGDLMTVKSIITAATYDALTPYIIIALIYFVITFTLSKLIKKFERRISYNAE